MEKKKSPRQELAAYAGCGNLRGLLEMNATGLSHGAIDLLVNITMNYCTSRTRRKRKP